MFNLRVDVGAVALLLSAVFGGVLATSMPVSALDINNPTLGGNCTAPPGQFGSAHFGMYNAIVRTKIKDWDNTTIGYVNDFGFTVTPMQHPAWLADYLSQQMPRDAEALAHVIPNPLTQSYLYSGNIFGAPIPFTWKVPANPQIANPIIHQQMAVVRPNGFPAMPITSPHVGQLEGVIGGGEQGSPMEGIFENIDLLDPSSYGDAAISGLLGAVIPSNVNQATLWASLGLGQKIRLDAGDTCEERNFTDAGRDPMASIAAYAFMNPNPISPTPGGVFRIPSTPLQFIGVGHGSGGFSKYNPSQNGNYMLDCYGRGIDVGINLAGWTNIGGFAGPILNTALDGIRIAAFFNSGIVAPGTLPLPMMEKYYGVYYHFSLDKDPGSMTLPPQFSQRQYKLEGLTDITKGASDLLQGRTLNGTKGVITFVAQLKQPYQLNPTIASTGPRITPQGQMHRFEIKINKHGFDDGSGARPYQPNKEKMSDIEVGSTRAQDGGGEINTKIYRVKVRPGVSISAIDRDKNPSSSDNLLKGMGDVCGEGNFVDNSLRNGLLGVNAQQPELNYAEDVLECEIDGDYTTHYDNRDDTGDVDVGNKFAPDPDDPTSSVREYRFGAEEAPGTKVCYLVQVSKYTNDVKRLGTDWWADGARWRPGNFNGAHNSTEESLTSWAKCSIAGFKPSLQVRGGDMLVEGVIDTATNSKEFLASTATPKEIRTYGSWAEYGALATKEIKGIGSGGSHRIGMPVEWLNIGYLTFSNNRTNTSPPTDNFGHYSAPGTLDTGFSRIERQFSSMTASNVLSGDVKVGELDGVYRIPGNVNLINGDLSDEKSVILLVENDATVTIRNNIKIPNTYDSIDQISQVVIAPASEGGRYTLNIAPEVSSVDAWLINPGGTINTCYTGLPGSDDENIPRALGVCDNHLDVNGPVAVKDLLLRRAGGKDQGDTDVRQSRPAENFNLRPDAYIWATQYVNDGGRKYITTHSKDLPPRY